MRSAAFVFSVVTSSVSVSLTFSFCSAFSVVETDELPVFLLSDELSLLPQLTAESERAAMSEMSRILFFIVFSYIIN